VRNQITLHNIPEDSRSQVNRNGSLRVKTHIERGGAGRPAACDLIRENKAVDLFPRIKSHAAGRSAPLRSAPLDVWFYPKISHATLFFFVF
jgi:hypothetical protein